MTAHKPASLSHEYFRDAKDGHTHSASLHRLYIREHIHLYTAAILSAESKKMLLPTFFLVHNDSS